MSFSVQSGTVHALIGENGAGKSTLLKILSGVYQPDAGTISYDGRSLKFTSPYDALRQGVAVIYQELHLVPEMSVAENVLLGHPPSSAGWIKRSELLERAGNFLRDVGLDIPAGAKLGSLSLAQRQMVEIAKALSRNASVVAFDEPTSSLSHREVESLFKVIGRLRQEGKAILYVSHRMDEIYRVCDAATVLRDGCTIETFDHVQSVSAGTLVNRMVGRSIEDIFGYKPRTIGAPLLEAHGITGPGLSEAADVQVRSGEIVGIFGLVGAGRSELLKAIYRGVSGAGGSVQVGGELVSTRKPSGSIRGGLMLCPEDRKKEGILGIRSVAENINISARRKTAKLGFWLDGSWERSNAERQVERLRVKTPSIHQRVGLLSGGNQQKTILGRWLSEHLKVLLLDEPTRGIDVGAKREIYDIVYELAGNGVGVLLVSSELPEVMGVCDRILVMRQGRIVADVPRESATQEGLLTLALPVAEGAA